VPKEILARFERGPSHQFIGTRRFTVRLVETTNILVSSIDWTLVPTVPL